MAILLYFFITIVLLYLTTINIEGIEILQQLDSRSTRDIYKAIIPLFADSYTVAIKIVYNPRRLSIYIVAIAYWLFSSNLIDTLSIAIFFPKLVVSLVPSIVNSRPIQLLLATLRYKPTF